MDSRSIVQVNTNKCRLCFLELHCYKDIYTEYTWRGQKEIYCEMLMETFNINPRETETAQIKMICELCITKLRDANYFKKRILDSNQKLINYVNFKEISSRCDLGVTVKVENVKHESFSDGEGNALDDLELSDYQDEGLMDVKKILRLTNGGSNIKPENKDGILPILEQLKNKPGIKLKKINSQSKKDIRKPLKAEKKKLKLEDESKSIKNMDSKPHKEIELLPMKELNEWKYTDNLIKIIENSNATPFLWEVKKKYVCMFCIKNFPTFPNLRVHTQGEHKMDEIKKILTNGQKIQCVKVEMSSLICKVCSGDCENLHVLKEHLIEKHNIEFHNVDNRLLPFKLSDDKLFPCHMCSEVFYSFHVLNMHLNSHYSNHICDTCGAGFKTITNLKNHLSRHITKEERSKPKCKKCDIIFDSIYKKLKHDVAVHNKKPLHKCPHCPERFMEFSSRLKHQLKCHEGTIQSFKCTKCVKTFYRKYLLSRHIRYEHNLEYNYKCDECDYKFSTKSKLKNHMIRHFGKKVHECKFCYKSYARAKTLKEHLKIHLNIRKWICNVCGEAFVQNVSLKNHMKKHL